MTADKFWQNQKLIKAPYKDNKEEIPFGVTDEFLESKQKFSEIADEFLFDSSGMEKSFSFNWDYLKNIEI